MSTSLSHSAGAGVHPDAAQFKSGYDRGEAQVVYTRCVADLDTPVSAYLKIAHNRAMSFLLESVEGGAMRGRYSVIGLEPDVVWRANGDVAEINRNPCGDADNFVKEKNSTLASLRALLKDSRINLPEELPPMGAGVFGYMGYDTIRLIEDLPSQQQDHLEVPDALLMRPQVVVIFDSLRDEMNIITPVRPDAKVSADEAYQSALARLADIKQRLNSPHADLHRTVSAQRDADDGTAVVSSNTSPDDYKAIVAKAKDYIAAGDIFQVVLSQRFSMPFPLEPFALYRALRRLNPSPYLFHLDFGGFSLVGSSPEILVRVRDGEVTIRPIAGTAPRGKTRSEDQELAAKLLADPKERSEHLMLLDLGRNDVGRVAQRDSVTVTDQFTIERYSHVMHIVSNVVGKLDPSHDSVSALMAGFPAGTVSGAPKVRAMEIIDELEPDKRGPYAGCVGYFTADGEMDTCIVLRTGLIKDGMLYVQAGAGIVYDSVPDNEQQECINKSQAVLRAAEEALRQG